MIACAVLLKVRSSPLIITQPVEIDGAAEPGELRYRQHVGAVMGGIPAGGNDAGDRDGAVQEVGTVKMGRYVGKRRSQLKYIL